jgi:threonine dehydrogenase-like Zn-dependent dehydrogenase
MANKDAFTSDEWTLLRIAPSFVSVGISAVDPSGLFSSIREVLAGASRTMAALNANNRLELFSALAADRSIPGVPDVEPLLGSGSHEQQMQNFKHAALDRVKAATGVVALKATPDEADAYRRMLIAVAEDAANAAKEGGFLGFGGVRVSEKERAFIDEVSKAAGLG